MIETENKSVARKIIVTHLYPVWDEVNVFDRIGISMASEVIEARDMLVDEI